MLVAHHSPELSATLRIPADLSTCRGHTLQLTREALPRRTASASRTRSTAASSSGGKVTCSSSHFTSQTATILESTEAAAPTAPRTICAQPGSELFKPSDRARWSQPSHPGAADAGSESERPREHREAPRGRLRSPIGVNAESRHDQRDAWFPSVFAAPGSFPPTPEAPFGSLSRTESRPEVRREVWSADYSSTIGASMQFESVASYAGAA